MTHHHDTHHRHVFVQGRGEDDRWWAGRERRQSIKGTWNTPSPVTNNTTVSMWVDRRRAALRLLVVGGAHGLIGSNREMFFFDHNSWRRRLHWRAITVMFGRKDKMFSLTPIDFLFVLNNSFIFVVWRWSVQWNVTSIDLKTTKCWYKLIWWFWQCLFIWLLLVF